MEEGWRSQLGPLLPLVTGGGDGGSARPRRLLAVLLLYAFSSQFLPIEPYLVPYLTSVKHFTNFQVTVDIYPCSVYAQLVFTLLMAPACFYFSHKFIISLGALGMLVTYIIVWVGKSLLSMQIMQTSVTTTASLLSFMLASELGQFLTLQEVSYRIFFIITLSSLGICSVLSFLLPKVHSSSSIPSIVTYFMQNEGWTRILKETWHGRTLQILSLWSAFAYAGFSLVQNYGTNLFDAIDPKSKFNGHVLAASQAAGCLGSFSAIYLENFANKNGMLIYVLGSAILSILCVCMGIFAKIWAAYLFYVAISGIYQALACLISVQCSRLLSNGQYILLFSINNFLGLVSETLIQAAVEIFGLSVFAQFISFSGFFLLATAIFIGLCFFDSRDSASLIVEGTNQIPILYNEQNVNVSPAMTLKPGILE